MDLFVNEISTLYTSNSLHEARSKMAAFLDLCKKAKQEGFQSFKISNDFENTYLTSTYTIHSWLNDSIIEKDKKDFYFSFRNAPYEFGIENKLDTFYYLNEPQENEHNGNLVEGLAWAYVCNSLAFSFPVNPVWQKEIINLEQETDEQRKNVQVNHVSLLQHFTTHANFIESQRTLVLVPSNINPANKHIHLSDDHGKDKLYILAKKLVNCPYVIEIPHSLPFDRHGRSFIREIHPNGRIDVTLIEEDDGYSMMVQTTGKTIRETQEIAKILKELY